MSQLFGRRRPLPRAKAAALKFCATPQVIPLVAPTGLRQARFTAMDYFCRAPGRMILRLLAWVLATAVPVAHANPPGLNSHEVTADHGLIFRYLAPAAKQVTLSLDYDPAPLPLRKGGDGVWSFTTKPLAPELHFYTFIVDGVPVRDPQNPDIEPNLFFINNTVRVSGTPPQLWDVTPVPHGLVHREGYTSQVLQGLAKESEEYYVYTPPGYDESGSARYPVLYLLHGWGALADDWVTGGQANLILDNLIAQGRVVPMIVVMPQSYGNLAFARNGPGVWGDPAQVAENIRLFESALLQEIIPRVERSYRVNGSRALAGLSMGGGQSLLIGLNHLDDFGWIGAFSSALPYAHFDGLFTGLAGAAPPKRLWISCGLDETENLGPNRALVAWLRAKGLSPTAVETPGIHNWHTWRENLLQFLPLLFRAAPGGTP
jgi:enterochelin esterase family protein